MIICLVGSSHPTVGVAVVGLTNNVLDLRLDVLVGLREQMSSEPSLGCDVDIERVFSGWESFCCTPRMGWLVCCVHCFPLCCVRGYSRLWGAHRSPFWPRFVLLKSAPLTKYIQKTKKYTSAARSTKKYFDQNAALQAACDTSIARVTGGVYPREGYRSVTPPC